MILIADCGSTNTTWGVIDNGKEIKRVQTSGMNILLCTQAQIKEKITTELFAQVDSTKVEKVYFYGAGCVSGKVSQELKKTLEEVFAGAEIETHSDLEAAAIALFGEKEGIACIIGTGSNSCLWDGKHIVDNISPLGYILGDEGGGAMLGRLLVGDVFKKQVPDALAQTFYQETGLNRDIILQKVYKDDGANVFLASLCPFIKKYIEEPAMHRLALNAFKLFFVRNVQNYKGYKNMTVSFIGSVAEKFAPTIQEAALALDITLGEFVQSPMDGLVKYFTK